jgi:TRAP-type uncharacterized transport system fused permease subunit
MLIVTKEFTWPVFIETTAGCIVIGLTNRNPVVAVAFLAAVALAVHVELLTEWIGLLPIIGASIAVSAWFILKDDAGKLRFFDIIDAFVVGAKYAISVGAAAATVGVIIGVVTLTGVGFKLSSIITGAAADMSTFFSAFIPASMFDIKAMTLFFTLVMTAIVCVALAAYAGASMAGADPFKTGNTSFRLGLAKALVPFVFVYSPAMLIVTKEFTWPVFIETTAGCIVGIVMLAVALTGYGLARIPNWERWWLGAMSILVISPNRTATLLGLVLALPTLWRQISAWRAEQPVPATS